MWGPGVYDVLVAPHVVCCEVEFNDFVRIHSIVTDEDVRR
jgi:hypothetical protein